MRASLPYVCLAWLGFFIATQAGNVLAASPNVRRHVIDIVIEGAERTNEEWLRQYIGMRFPRIMDNEEVETVKKKLMTTQVFLEVTPIFESVPGGNGTYYLRIKVVERWTTIPVLRGALGGGTNLKVFGLYDIHTWGRLWTVGGETHQYGNAPIGGVVWARAPRWLQGQHVLGTEYWREFRERTVFDDEDERVGFLRSGWSMFRFIFMNPVRAFNPLKPAWKLGLDARIRREEPARYVSDDDALDIPAPEGITLSGEPQTLFMSMMRLAYDSVTINRLSYDGVRFLVMGGPQFGEAEVNSRAEHELFYFSSLTPRTNLAAHYLVGQSTSSSLESQYFLGGLESVRGIPQGALFGTRAYYGNFELRHLSLRYKYLWLQNVAFYDVGGAGADWSQARESVRSSVGVGFRFALPQVYRLMLRIDYAWSLDEPGTSGVTAGMNQFFQPYKPL